MQTHTETVQSPVYQVEPSEPAQRVVLHGVSWETYERLLADYEDSHAAHFAYDQGVLEIMVLSFEHEKINRLLHDLFTMIALGMNVEFVNAGSTTFKRTDLAKGFEPDSCFYIEHVERVRSKKKIDLTVDPPPDLVIEIDITSPSLNKFPIYARIGVPEVWRYDRSGVTIFRLEGEDYQSRAESTVLPGVTSQVISRHLAEGQTMKRTAWLRAVQEWARQHGPKSE